LLTHIAAMESVSLYADELLTAFLELEAVDHRLRDDHELQEKTSYILMNPVRKGLCERTQDWVWVYRANDRPPPHW